jgi:leucyl aminopeptidase (aminopeptidase T)
MHPILGGTDMPLYLDEHRHVPGANAKGVAEAHMKDLQTQSKHGVKYLRYWVDEKQGKIWCLVEAPNKEAAERVHREAHGLVADEIHEVSEGS